MRSFSSVQQRMYFAKQCLQRHGTITHEMLHTLGLGHEHQRPDIRDDFVTVQFDKVQPELEHNFNRLDETKFTTFGIPNDFGSVLNYPRTAFSKDGSDTLIPKVKCSSFCTSSRKPLTNFCTQKIAGEWSGDWSACKNQ